MARKTERLEAEIAVKDNATDQIEKIIKSNKKLSTEMLRLRENMNRMKQSAAKRTEIKIETAKAKANLDNLKGSLDRVRSSASNTMHGLKTLGVVAGTAIAAGFGIAIKSGLELEKQMASIQHFIGVNNKGMSQKQSAAATDKYIQEMRKYATATPFASNDVMAAGSRAVGVAGGDTKMANELVRVAGDMAALSPGKSMMDAMEALADAKTGEMERLKEFGFKVTADEFKGYVGKGGKDKLTDDETNKAYSTLVNKKLNPYFGGGAEKISKTTGGKISTIQGNISSGLQDAGYNMMKGIDPKVLDGLIKSSEKLGATLGNMGAKMINAFAKAKPHIIAISKAIVVATSAVVAFKFALSGLTIIKTIITLFKAWRAGTLLQTAATLGFNTALWASPLTWVAAGIAAVVAAGVALYLNWEKVRKKTRELSTEFGGFQSVIANCLGPIGFLINAGIEMIKQWDSTKSVWENIWNAIKKSAEISVNGVIGSINKLIGAINKIPGVSIPLVAKVNWTESDVTPPKTKTPYERTQLKKPKTSGGAPIKNLPVAYGIKKAIGGVIPRDNYPTLLHEGEKVQTKQEVYQASRKQGGNTYKFGDIIIQGSGNAKQDARKIMNEIVRELEMAGGAGA